MLLHSYETILNLKTDQLKTLLLLLFLFVSSQGITQINKTSISFGPTFADPVNTSGSEYFKKGFGAGVRAYYPVSTRGSLMANINYVSFSPQPKYNTSYSLTSFKLGYKTFIGNSGFYAYADAGLVLLTAKDVSISNSTNKITSGVGLGLGYSIPVNRSSYIDFSPSLNLNNAALFGRRLTPELNISYRINLSGK